MNGTLKLVLDVAAIAVAAGGGIWLLIRWLRKSEEDPRWLIVKWVLTAAILWVLISKIAPFAVSSQIGAFVGIPTAAICGIVLAGLWGASLTRACIKPLTSAFDGGTDEVDPSPFYAIARALRTKGKHVEAVAEVRKQLERFPNDFDGILLLASLQAESLGDLQGAELTLNRYCENPESPPQHTTAALYQLADWHLALGQDPVAARRTLERVLALCPGTELALQTAQRIAHLPTPEWLSESQDPATVVVPEGPRNLGLRKVQKLSEPAEVPAGVQAAEYVRHLEEHPHDTETRELLAVLYAEHYGRLDLAKDQFEQLVQAHPQSHRQVAHWLNRLADLQVKGGADFETVRHTLQTIVDLYPNLPVADSARNRMDRLQLEFKGIKKSQAVTLGSYEQNLGLKTKRR